MKKLVVHSAPKMAGVANFLDENGDAHELADYKGKVVLVNFWAVWCAPCRKEMPSLDALEQALGGEDFQVVPIATGRNRLPGIKKLFTDVGVTSLPILTDPRQGLAREMGVLGLPATVLLDREGREVARMTGDADWNSDSARAIIEALIAG